jgi:hypothetical protein
MIADTDTVLLAAGVTLEDGQLGDTVRGSAWPLNATGAFVLVRAGSPIGRTVAELADAFLLPTETARGDVLRFVWSLNALALVNIERQGPRLRRFADWLLLAVRLAPAGAVPAVAVRRHVLDTRTLTRAVASAARALIARVIAVAVVATVVAAQFAAVLGSRGIALALAVGAGTGIGLGLHEVGHIASLRGVPSALVVRGRRTYVLHAPVGRERRAFVALAGPLVAVALGVALVLGGTARAVPALVILGCPLVAHAVSLTVAGGDGRIACEL